MAGTMFAAALEQVLRDHIGTLRDEGKGPPTP